MYQNILITGTIGTGKTSSAMYPFTKQLISYNSKDSETKMGMLILDVKGNYYKKVKEFVENENREQDLIVLELGGYYKYNPLHKPNLKASVLANRLKTILLLFSPNNSESFWIDKCEQVLTECIKLCRLYNNNYVTFEEIHKLVTIDNYYLEKVKYLRELFILNKLNREDIYNLLTALNFFEKEYNNLDSRTKSILKSEITRITNTFVSDYKVHSTFCPNENELNFFGFEDVLKAIWLKPMNQMMDVPLVGRLNAVFVIAIGFGMFIILICMVFNIINSIRRGDTEKTWFDSNAVAGLVFYGSIVLTIGLFISGKKLPAAAILVIMFGVPLLLMFLKEPLTNLVEKKSKILPEQKGMFFVQSFFELFEVLLSYLSNTLSFLRIGAFAVSHAAMMEVVLMLAGATNGGSPNWVVVVLGNIFVCAMEGLIVGIQVLRLEYYEIFSRFYAGNGREFKPFMKAAHKN